MKPTVSIIIPHKNRLNFLRQALDSVKKQNFDQWEAIIVDDGSEGQIILSIEQYCLEQNIKLVRRDREPEGAPTCRNIGLEWVRGEFVVFLDSDDLLAPHCLEQRVKVMEENPDLDFAVFPMLIFNDKPEDAEYLWNKVSDEDDLSRFLRLDAVWQTTGPIWRKSALEKTGGFTERLHCWQDVDFHLKALFESLKYKKFYDLPPDCYYRRHSEGSISQSRINTPEKLQSRWEIFEFSYCQNMNRSDTRGALLFRNLTFMLMGILISAIKATNFSFAISKLLSQSTIKLLPFLKWLSLTWLFFLFLFRINKFKHVSLHIDSVIKKFQGKNTIGKFAYR